jgi:NagD protein
MKYPTPNHYYSGYAFDLDGTIYLEDGLLPGVRRVLEILRQRRIRIVFVSNNPTHSCDEMRAKLAELGISASHREIVNSSEVLVRYLQERELGRTVYPISEEPLRRELIEAGFDISEKADIIDVVIASFDRTFDYHKLQVAFDAIQAGASFIATNADPYCPVPGGGEPDAAAVIGAVEGCTGVTVEAVLGKPSLMMAKTILQRLDADPEECLMIGDRLQTDILMGKRVGLGTALVLTGATSEADLETAEIKPDFVLPRLEAVLPGDQE